jgi:chemotaxis protein methyltransferase CheR
MSSITITEKEFRQIVSLLIDKYGINLSQKKDLIVGRLQNYLRQSNFNNFTEYYEHIVNDRTGDAITLLVNKLTTNYTYFMREIEHFDFFRSAVLPHIVQTSKTKDMRIWSAGCSSGEEPYSIAMCISEFFSNGVERQGWDSKVLATDISERVLTIASEGIYLTESLDPLPPSWRRAFFQAIDGASEQIVDWLRKEVIFRKFNLMETRFPFRKKFHIIWCRNVMIYFDHETRKRLIDKFYDVTEPGGYLFIGHSESIARNETRYTYVMPAIYRREQ